ncbi:MULTISPECIES: acyltransferase domain-containing protein [Streptomyces]|uniref:Malonyl CoA-acyl carrier protein transacylase n=1 Tax=Streptomyces clavifer TaxID=68188 RepID=A0ABS4V575_9ACTN|nr:MULTISPECIES: acyltransferase domain-containing protein [Streptomyces]MBP2359054.1 malonyl CoA-acyl carrier protein transacylase [Streptomyces clavifer]MDX2745731.1 acyltransferase domain-containing protein [Streptomyces sp. NRRL_B-2557]WRY84196.1 acyltransferase domain-containing protein [Streptomyces clavifer]WUC29963.1 acyltransferase domain-containing protein [Streptomyces clavifer]
MSLTQRSAVVRRLIVSPGSAPQHSTAPAVASAAAVSAVLRAFGRPPEDLPARTVVLLGATAFDGVGPAHEGFTVRTEATPGRALRRAHRELHEGTADLALVAGFGEPDPWTITVYAVKRAAEAVADGDAVLGVLDVTTPADEDTVPPLRPLRGNPRGTDPDRHRLVCWSGRNADDEMRVRDELLPMLSGVHREVFPALPATVPCGTPPGPVRGAAVTVSALAARSVHKARTTDASHPRPVALLFPGQGSQHAGMAAGLYRREPVFTAAVDAALSHMGEEGPRIRADWLDPARAAIDIDDVRRAQPLLFAIDYALGRLVLSWGVRPTALLGHSAGELVAATFAGVVSLRDAVAMVMARVREAVKIPAGGMLAVAASEERVLPYLTDDVAVAAVNANQQVMLAGSKGPLTEIAARLKADGHTVVTVPATSPFHSPAMAPASDAVEVAYRAIPLREPKMPLYSGYTGALMSPEEARSPRFWARQITDTVYFRKALDELLAADDVLLIEVGPRQTLTAFARRHRSVRLGAGAVSPILPARAGTPEADRQSVLTAAARLWTEGHDLDLNAVARLWTWSEEETAPAAPRVPAQAQAQLA